MCAFECALDDRSEFHQLRHLWICIWAARGAWPDTYKQGQNRTFLYNEYPQPLFGQELCELLTIRARTFPHQSLRRDPAKIFHYADHYTVTIQFHTVSRNLTRRARKNYNVFRLPPAFQQA